MRQLLYVSTRVPTAAVRIGGILIESRRNNDAVGVTGLLYTDGQRFLQVLEGEEPAVTATFERIRRDPRHQAVVLLSDRAVEAREFGTWAMAHRDPGDAADLFDERVTRLLAGASDSVRGTFLGLIAARRAA